MLSSHVPTSAIFCEATVESTTNCTEENVKNLRYFERRMLELDYDAEKDTSWYASHPDEPYCLKNKHPLFWEDVKTGDICIGYMNLDGGLMTYDANLAKSRQKVTPYFRRRLASPTDDNKYKPCAPGLGSSVYLTKRIQVAFQQKKQIERLIIVEGEFKAFVGSKAGLHIVAIPGIGIWKHKDDVNIFPIIREICQICNVQEIAFLTDADTMQVKYKEDKDLYVRPYFFYCAVEKFKMLTKELDVNQYFIHLKEDSPHKGLDDLLKASKEDKSLIINDLLGCTKSGLWFKSYHISNYSYQKIKSLFHIQNPSTFYRKYEGEIGMQEFVFNHGRYVLDEDTNEVLTLQNGLAHGMFMVCGRVFKEGIQPMLSGVNEHVWVEVPRTHLKAQFKREKIVNEVIESMPWYDGVTNIPSHGNDYVAEIVTEDDNGRKLRWKNIYHRVIWKENEGEFPNIMKIIKHIFGKNKIWYKGEWIDEWELGLDYTQILWQRPIQKLPILTCVSAARNTGKSTYFDFLRVLIQQNARQVRAQDLISEFSSYFATATLLIAEEFSLNNMPLLQKLKNMVTGHKQPYRAMHKDTREIDSFIHVGITSNALEDFTCLDDEEVRFWVREIPVLDAEEMDLDILKRATAEIPAFIYFLNRRKMVTQRESRAWFAFDLIKNNAFKKVLALSKPEIQKEVEQFLREVFSQTALPVLRYSTKDIQSEIRSTKYTTIQIRDCLTQKMKVNDSKWSNEYSVFKWDDANHEVVHFRKKSIFYKFYISDYFSADELAEILSLENLIELEEELNAAGKKMIFQDFTVAMLWKNKEIKEALLHKELNFNDLNSMNLLSKTFKDLSALLV
jgi:hypothetical protein